jgi:hypothetical protein
VYLVTAAWVTLNLSSGGGVGTLYSFHFGDFVDLMIDPDWAIRTVLAIGLFTGAQAMFLLPVARPSLNLNKRGMPIWLCGIAAGAAIALLWAGAVMAVIGALQVIELAGWETPWGRALLIGLGASSLITWVIAAALVFGFVSRGNREDRVSRLAAMIFLGTVIEAVAIVPLDVMMRRRTSCYCDTATFWALTACGTVGLFVIGPAIFLPLVAKRRRRWYQGKCDACGYDMRGTPGAQRCPECGAGWRGGE